MKYRAIAVGVENDGHPLQAFSEHLPNVKQWAESIRDKYKAPVRIFVMEERLLETVEV
jgi:hypothetical protein